MSVHIHVYVRVYAHVYTHVYAQVYTHVDAHVYAQIRIHALTHLRTWLRRAVAGPWYHADSLISWVQQIYAANVWARPSSFYWHKK